MLSWIFLRRSCCYCYHFEPDSPLRNVFDKRTSFSASDLSGNEEGAMTLEASLIVPIFLIVLLMLTSAGEILMIHQQISHGACDIDIAFF